MKNIYDTINKMAAKNHQKMKVRYNGKWHQLLGEEKGRVGRMIYTIAKLDKFGNPGKPFKVYGIFKAAK